MQTESHLFPKLNGDHFLHTWSATNNQKTLAHVKEAKSVEKQTNYLGKKVGSTSIRQTTFGQTKFRQN
jgi:hypothetical protein